MVALLKWQKAGPIMQLVIRKGIEQGHKAEDDWSLELKDG